MSGISSKAAGSLENRKLYNSIEHTTDLDLNQYDAFFRTMDPQTGRWWQIDPKGEATLSVSPYVAMDNNPINKTDPFGDIVEYERGDGVSNKEFRQMKREIRQERRNSGTFNKMFKEFKNDKDRVYTYKAVNSSKGAETTKTDNGYQMAVGIHYQDENQSDLQSSQVATIAHETGHAWRKTHNLDPEKPGNVQFDPRDNPAQAAQKMEEGAKALVNYNNTSEGGASHIENVVIGELKRSGSSLYDNLNFRSIYSGGLKLELTPSLFNPGHSNLMAQPTNLNTLTSPKDANYYLHTQVDIYKENGL